MSSSGDWSSQMRKILPQLAATFVQRAQVRAKTNRIKRSFVIHEVENIDAGRIRITITNDADEAGAYEWGSGIWATEGATPARYPIRPRNGRLLVFPWPQARNLNPNAVPGKKINTKVTVGASGKAFLPGVMHPGVRPQPYIAPAIQEMLPQIAKEVGEAFIDVTYKSIWDAWNAKK